MLFVNFISESNVNLSFTLFKKNVLFKSQFRNTICSAETADTSVLLLEPAGITQQQVHNECAKKVRPPLVFIVYFHVCLLFYILATSEVISGRALTCDSAHSWQLYSAVSTPDLQHHDLFSSMKRDGD